MSLRGWVKILIPMGLTLVGCLLLFILSFLISQIPVRPGPKFSRCLHNHCYLPLRAAYSLQKLGTYFRCNQFLITTDIPQFTCQHCNFTSYSSLIVKRHSVRNHGFFCKICVFTTKSKSEFLQHRKTHPITLKCLRFEECGFEGFKESVRKHQEDIHGIITSPIITKFGEKTCFRCGYSTTCPNSFR